MRRYRFILLLLIPIWLSLFLVLIELSLNPDILQRSSPELFPAFDKKSEDTPMFDAKTQQALKQEFLKRGYSEEGAKQILDVSLKSSFVQPLRIGASELHEALVEKGYAADTGTEVQSIEENCIVASIYAAHPTIGISGLFCLIEKYPHKVWTAKHYEIKENAY